MAPLFKRRSIILASSLELGADTYDEFAKYSGGKETPGPVGLALVLCTNKLSLNLAEDHQLIF